MLNKIKRFLIFQFTIGVVLAVAGGIWYTNKNSPENPYFIESKKQLSDSEGLNELLGKGWTFGNYQVIRESGLVDTVTFSINSSNGYKCIRGDISKNKDKYAISNLGVANKQSRIAPASAPYCAFAVFENIDSI